MQIIVADDGSTDETSALLQSIQLRYELKRTRLDGRGCAAARNAAARLADHQVLIFLDDDQVTSPELVATHLEAHKRSGNVIVQGDHQLAPGWNRRGASLLYDQSRARHLGSTDPKAGVPFRLFGANFSVRQKTWARVGGFDESLPRNQDLDFGLRVADTGVPIVLELRALSHHLHTVSSAAFRHQCFTSGRCLVRISRKRSVPLDSLVGSPIDQLADRVVKRFWIAFPRSAHAAGRCLSGALGVADHIRLRPAQLLAARLVRRFYHLGGIALERASTAGSPGGHSDMTIDKR
jgi:GT2 family glycosyltransferase